MCPFNMCSPCSASFQIGLLSAVRWCWVGHVLLYIWLLCCLHVFISCAYHVSSGVRDRQYRLASQGILGDRRLGSQTSDIDLAVDGVFLSSDFGWNELAYRALPHIVLELNLISNNFPGDMADRLLICIVLNIIHLLRRVPILQSEMLHNRTLKYKCFNSSPYLCIVWQIMSEGLMCSNKLDIATKYGLKGVMIYVRY